MVISPRSDLGSVLAGILVLLLTLTAVGRGAAAGIGSSGPRAAIARVAPPICHAGRQTQGPVGPEQRGDTDCCTAGALLAAPVLPVAPERSRFAVAVVSAPQIVCVATPPDRDRLRLPRQTRGPPAG